ncbi:hypothetical protein KQX54_020143 [Cotesia glomerata]|uniref:Uncharacterized protein n=1 Tax=Cotesia glomerata TaxID=32391 RepID=A0AAV7IHI3_COTGL|nr:hypothetical protein KQX54_020143 [Cotesia glomerata]
MPTSRDYIQIPGKCVPVTNRPPSIRKRSRRGLRHLSGISTYGHDLAGSSCLQRRLIRGHEGAAGVGIQGGETPGPVLKATWVTKKTRTRILLVVGNTVTTALAPRSHQERIRDVYPPPGKETGGYAN